MSPRSLACLIVAWTITLAGCGKTPSVPAAPALSADPAHVVADEDAGEGNGYAYHVRYPQLAPEWSTLADALRTYAAARKKEFLDARLADGATNAVPYSLDLEFNVARRTSDFVSILANGNIFTGGAHPTPLIASFNLHMDDGKLIALTDLFVDSRVALEAVSAEARRQLEGNYEAKMREITPEKEQAAALRNLHEWIERGTQAKAENFAVFLVDGLETKAIGLTLIFPPTQVSANADAAQQVEVPAKVFYQLLKPEYRDAFQIDNDANKIAPGVR